MNLEQLTEQQIFDLVWDHFITKGNGPGMQEAENGAVFCSYRGPCAVGVFLSPPSRASLDGGGCTVEDIQVFLDMLLEARPPNYSRKYLEPTGKLGMALTKLTQEEIRFLYNHAEFLALVQDTHDIASTVPNEAGFHTVFIQALTTVAATRGLEVPQ